MSATAASAASQPPSKKKLKLNSYPFYSPRFWHGMCLGDWLRLMARGRFRIHPLRICMALIITVCTVGNSFFAFLQRLFYGGKIEHTPIEEPPVFIIGHWRSGTTHLHELMVRDARFAYPTYYECYEPNHFLITGWFAPTLLWPLLPRKRPMDNMETGWHRPQEDEFALCAMGSPTPYYRMAYPNEPPLDDEFLDMQGCRPQDLARWRRDLKTFVQALTLKKQKRLIMKSPPHTGRVEELANLFPGVKFVHISRNPYTIFASTRRLWVSLDAAQGLQHPHHKHLDEYVFHALERMYGGFERQRAALAPGQLCDVKYEDLVRDPVGQVRRVYEELGLGDFEPMRAALEEYAASQKNYQTNKHDLEPEIKAEIRRRWAGYFERYGYE